MSSAINSYVYDADHSEIAGYLSDLQETRDSGGYDGYPQVLERLDTFEGDTVKKLYNTSVQVLGSLEGVTIEPGRDTQEFEERDFSATDFSVAIDASVGDFTYWDFGGADFSAGFSSQAQGGFSSVFNDTLTVFGILKSYQPGLPVDHILNLNTSFMRMYEDMNAIRDDLDGGGGGGGGGGDGGGGGGSPTPLPPEPSERFTVPFSNSSSLYLQAAGSNGSDGSAPGVHLRWALTGELAGHLPRGNYGASTSGYNRPGDSIIISRAPYTDPCVFTLDFQSALPAIDNPAFRWTYILNRITAAGTITNLVSLSFMDTAMYLELAAKQDPAAAPFSFLSAYKGITELSVAGKELFSFAYELRQNAPDAGAILKIRGYSRAEPDTAAALGPTFQHTAAAAGGIPASGKLWGEGLLRIQLQSSASGYLRSVAFETYADLISTRPVSSWSTVGSGMALSLDDTTVFNRLENAAYPVDHLWPQFMDGMTVRVSNYHEKWLGEPSGEMPVKTAVQRYLDLSETDPRANGIIQLPGALPDDEGFPVSYLELLNLMSFDFHLARMLGLGHIDTQGNSTGQFIYKISYTARKAPGSGELVAHEYLSLPTGRTDARLPEKPAIRPVTYTLPSGRTGAYDANGYQKQMGVRIVNIGRAPYGPELADNTFFYGGTSADFSVFDHSPPVFFGIAYRHQGAAAYQKPGITSPRGGVYAYYAYDTAHPDTGTRETVPVPDAPESLYIHMEDESGVHAYAIYGINWFSRASVLSDEVLTDATVFPPVNNLMPPPAIAAQYIQEEDSPLFTTQTEQDWLTGRNTRFPGQDTGFTRLTFNWLDIIELTHVRDLSLFNPSTVTRAKKIKAWFRPGQPLQIEGVITAISPVGGAGEPLQVTVGDYRLLDGSQVFPTMAAADLFRFTGSAMTTPEGQFEIIGVTATTAYPDFTIVPVTRTISVNDPADPLNFATRDTYLMPAIGSRFTVTENLSDDANWVPLAETIDLIDLSDQAHPVFETSTTESGTTTQLIGGITGSARVEQLLDTEDQLPIPGCYSVTFSPAVTLAPHPQVHVPFDPANPDANAPGSLRAPHVTWYNGQVRLPLAADPLTKKLVEVIRIFSTSPLTIYVYDTGYADQPLKVSSGPSDLVPGANFHPGYKTYFFPEPAPDHLFNATQILPGRGQADKKTMIALQSADDGPGGTGFVSRVSPPAVLLAVRIVPPVRLPLPRTYGMRVSPNTTTRAAFTFDVDLLPDSEGQAREPFGLMFYRTGNDEVLTALYAPATVAAIHSALNALTTDTHHDQRYNELVNLVFDPAHPGHFNVFDASPQPYGFPVPDKSGLLPPAYAEAIRRTLLPLTAQLPVVKYFKTGYQTENRQPRLRDMDGNLLDPVDPAFDPFPMIRRYIPETQPATTSVRVTDYSLNGSSRYLYFYGAAEVTGKLIIGPLSPLAGPVSVLHTLPADAPVIRNITTDAADAVSVSFYISPFPAEDPLSKLRIYRTLDPDHTLALQTMDSFLDVVLSPDTPDGLIATDTFSDLSMPPYGETVYYRLAFIRTIFNERDETEDVIGLGSVVEAVRLIDTHNPDAPALGYDSATHTLNWAQVTNKGSYDLFQQNSRGNWQRIYSVTPAGPGTLNFTLPAAPVLTDADGNRIYYRFKVSAANSSGLRNLTDNIITI
jgi:hypothetical protein